MTRPAVSATRTRGRGGVTFCESHSVAYCKPAPWQGVNQEPGTRRPGRRENRMLSWKGTVVKLLALAAFIASFAGEAEGWTW
jgi:hypothetical protein